MFLVPSGSRHWLPPIAAVRHSQSLKVELKSFAEVMKPMLRLKLLRVTLGLVDERISFMRPGVAWSPQPSTTGLPTLASETLQMLEVQAGGVWACAAPADSRKSVIAAARVASLARGGG